MASPCAQNLWVVNDDAEFLDNVKAGLFQSLTYNLPYIMKMTRPDIEPDVAFLTTRVAKRNVDDWKKLRRFISYLNQTLDDVSIIGNFDITEFFTWFYE